jgi:hypothetical protein
MEQLGIIISREIGRAQRKSVAVPLRAPGNSQEI